MHEIELVLALLVVVVALAPLARLLRLPYPILLVLGGLLLALVPLGFQVTLAPGVVFLLFLPPLLYLAAFNTSVREVRALLRPIFSLAVGLPLVTTVAVAVLVHALRPEMGWPAAFALGAIVSPPDAVAATAVFRRLAVPRRMVTLLEGESLFNDATALVAYQAAVRAGATATFALGDAGLRFLVVAAGGIIAGVAVGWAVAWLRRRLSDPPVEITVSLLTPFAAFLAAEQIHVSGVLAVVVAGLALGWLSPRIMAAETRVRARSVWEMIEFVLNGLVFILIGLQLSAVVSELSGRTLLTYAGLGLLVSLAVVLVRLAWVFGMTGIVWGIERRLRAGVAPPRWPEVGVVGWAGMRGVVSLATALALPLDIPERDLLLFITFTVILVTLVGQGLTLPWLVRRLGVGEEEDEHPELHARAAAAVAATARIEELAAEWPDHLPLIEALRAQYGHRASHFGDHSAEYEAEFGLPNGHVSEAEQEMIEHRLIRREVIDAERTVVLDLRRSGEITDEVWRRIERDLDLEELRLEA